MPVLTSSTISIDLDDQFPRITRLCRLDTGATLFGCPVDQPFALELNGVVYHPEDLRVSVVTAPQASTYQIELPTLELVLYFRFDLHDDQLVITLPEVQERGSFRLNTLYIPDHRLISGLAVSGDSFLRLTSWRIPWSVGWLSGGEATDYGSERLGQVIDCVPERGPLATQHACVWNSGICAVLHTSIWSNPLMTSLDTFRAPVSGRAGRFSIWSDVYHYRLRGTLADPLRLTLAVLGDYDRNGTIDWCDAANWEGDQRMPGDDPYRETLVYKLGLDEKKRAAPYRTFAQCLDVIRLLHDVSGGLKQVVYLVGWQHVGHDSGFPNPQLVNARIGGESALCDLITQARQYNCVVSVHANVDDAYTSEPGYDPALLSRGPDGQPVVWFYNNFVDNLCYSVNHTLSVETGAVQRWLEELLALSGAQETIHFDAFRPTSETWLEDGSLISMESEYQRGMVPIVRWLRDHGVDVTSEGPLLDLVRWTWMLPDWRHHYLTVLTHGRMGGFYRITGGYHRRRDHVGDGLGCGFIWGEVADPDRRTALIHFYETWMYDQILRRKRMIGYRVGDWFGKAQAQYADNTSVHTGWSADELAAKYEGIPIARGTDRFLPWRPNQIFAFSRSGGPQAWQLPGDWDGRAIAAVVLMDDGAETPLPVMVEGRQIRFEAPACQPVRLTCT